MLRSVSQGSNDRSPTEPLPAEVDLRLLQANERTLLAWIRTGIALMAFGFVVARLGVFLRHIEPAARDQVGLSMFIGAGLVVLGCASNLAAAYRYVRVRGALLTATPVRPGMAAGLTLAIALALIGAILSVYLVMM